jgi:hypothetical protein
LIRLGLTERYLAKLISLGTQLVEGPGRTDQLGRLDDRCIPRLASGLPNAAAFDNLSLKILQAEEVTGKRPLSHGQNSPLSGSLAPGKPRLSQARRGMGHAEMVGICPPGSIFTMELSSYRP